MRHLRQGLDGWLQPPVKRYEPRSRRAPLPAQPAAAAREQGRTAPADLQSLPADAAEDGVEPVAFAGQSLLAGFLARLAVEPDRHRPVVDELDLHLGAKDSS